MILAWIVISVYSIRGALFQHFDKTSDIIKFRFLKYTLFVQIFVENEFPVTKKIENWTKVRGIAIN